jgi:hypothetical protein
MQKLSYRLLVATTLLIESISCASAANTGVKFANGVNGGNINVSGLSEMSGCAASRVNDGVFYMQNDGGHAAGFYAVTKAGVNKGFFTPTGAANTDTEDIAVGPGPVPGQSYIYLGDIGDNGAGRSTTQVYRMAEPKIGSTSATLPAEKFTFKYPDGPRDAETLMVDSRTSDVYVVSKRQTAADGNRVYLFKAPLTNGGTYTGQEVARVHTTWLTGGDISADGSRILVKTTTQTYLWLRKDGESVGTAMARTPVTVPTANEQQGEAVCWDATGTDYYTSSEGVNQPFFYFKSLDSSSGSGSGGGTGTGTGGGSGGSVDAPTSTNSLAVNVKFNLNNRMDSTNGNYHFYLQGDGNLVLRDAAAKAIWASATNGKGGVRLVIQGDGNLVLYTSAGKAVWATGTVGSGAAYLIVQSDGNLVMYTSAGKPVWSTGTSDGSTGGGGTGGTQTGVLTPAPTASRYDHVVMVMMENEGADSIFGSSSTPYIHSLASQGVRFTASHAVTHPSEPNYLALFSGSTQGITDDSCPNNFSGKPNLGSQLIAAGRTFKGYSESMPSDGYTGCSSGKYVRKHNPWVMFNNVPATSNVTYAAFPADYTKLPTVSIVVPNQCNNMHDCSLATGDNWLRANIDNYAQWAKTHNSLLILTWDEDGGNSGNVIPTIFVGANVNAGTTNSQSFNHYGLLRTLQDMYGLAPINNTVNAAPIQGFGASNGSWTAQANDLTAAAGSASVYTMAVPSGATNLKFTTSGGSGDADVYVKFGAAPTTSSYDCRSATSGTNAQSCAISNVQGGTYQVLVQGKTAYSGVTLTGSYTK